MDEEISQIKRRGVLSAGSLFFQSSFSAVLGFIAFFILTIKSGTYLLGIYNTVLAMMSFFSYFTNLGLAAAIIQKPEIKKEDLSTAFYIQLFLSVAAIVVGFFLTDYLFKFYKDLPANAVYLYWGLLASFFFLSLKTIPSVLLEKKIKIYKVVVVQMIENTVFYLSVIIFSLLGYDIYSLLIAVLARSITGVVLIYFMQPWVPSFTFSWQSAKSLLSYGIPFQGNSFLALIKDDLLIIYLGGVIGFRQLGIVVFAKKYAEFSIRLIMDNLSRVAFPIFSRFQKDKIILKKSVEKILLYQSIILFPAIVGAMFVFPSVLKVIPGYFDKWNVAVFSFYFFSLSAFFVSLYSPFINLFNAIGKVKTSLLFMVLWTTLTWALVPLFNRLFGFNGISMAFFVMSLTFIFVILTAKKTADFSLLNSYRSPLLATFVMALFLFISTIFGARLNNLIFLVLSIGGGALIYGFVIYLDRGRRFFEELLALVRFKKIK